MVVLFSAINVFAQNDQWTQLGMVKFPENPSVQTTGMGRVSHLAFHPTDSNIVYAASASGGLWRSVNDGKTWKPLTDGFPNTACASICINRKNPKTLYLGTGDANYYGGGLGVWKSTNEGKTWTQMNSGMGNTLVVQIVMHPSDTNTLVATTRTGIFKTTNGGATWTKKSSIADSYNDLVMKPGSGFGLYATSFNSFYYSKNFGETWTQLNISQGDTFSGIFIGVTKADTNVVYCVAWRNKSWGSKTYFGGLFKSNNGGLNWTKKSSTPQILGYSSDGSSNDGQGAYNLTITVDPKNAANVFVGAINIWNSRDSGSTWKLKSPWAFGVHADKHHFIYSPHNANKLYISHDGGLDRSLDTGNTWKTITDGLTASEFYKMGQSALNREKALGGLQDNGLNLYKNGIFYTIRGGDHGGDFLFDYLDSNSQYFMAESNQYNLNNLSSKNINAEKAGLYELNWKDSNIMYSANRNLFISKNLRSGSVSWTKLSDSLLHYGTATTTALTSVKANQNFIYWAKNNGVLYRIDNVNSGSPKFVLLTKPSGNISKMATYLKDSNVIYIVIGGKIYKSTNKGNSWWDMSKNLSGMGIVNVQVDDYVNDSSIYVATNAGVYYRNRNLNNWISVSNNLPAIAGITDFEMYNNGTSKSCLRLSTYGRGIWQSALYQYQTRKPVADFTVNASTMNCPKAFILNDLSTGGKYNRSWSVLPYGSVQYINGTDSTSRQPEIQFLKSGKFTISLIVKNNYGSSELIKSQTISELIVPATCSVNTTNLGNYTIGIHRFEMAGLDKSSPYCTYKNPNIEDYSCSNSIMVKPGKAYTAWITNGSAYNETGRIYIDYNNDGDFLDANEFAASFANGTGRKSTTLTIQGNPPVVNTFTRMRVISDYSALTAACGTLSYGQAEDYSIFIDNTRPTISWQMPKPKVYGKFKGILKLSEYCENFDTSLLKFSNAKIVGMTKINPLWYEFDLTPIKPGKIYLNIPLAAFSDGVGNTNFAFVDSTEFEFGLSSFTFLGHSVKDSIFQNDTGGIVKCYVYYGTNKSNLVASFTVSDSTKTLVASTLQASGITANNFTNTLVYELKNSDGTFTKKYQIQVIELPDTSCELLSFDFKNPNVSGAITWSKNPGKVQITLPFGTSINNRSAHTTISNNAKIYAENKIEISGTTLHDFNKVIKYKVVAMDTNYFKEYEVTTKIAKNAACDLLSWSIVTPNTTGNIVPKDTTGGWVNATLPFGTSRNALISKFKLSDSAVLKINRVIQVSETTVNNYTDTLVAEVIAHDGVHKKVYKLIVKNELNDACKLLSFRFNSPSAIGIITHDTTGGTVAISVPENTVLTNLIAVFTLSDSAKATVGSTPQISGVTSNDFSNIVTYNVQAQNGIKSKKYLVTVTKILGLIDPKLDLFKMYPNPVSDYLTIELASDIQNYEIRIFDVVGKEVFARKNRTDLDVSKLSPGIYEVQLNYGKGKQSKRLVVE